MPLTHLRYFDEVVRSGSIRIAAEKLHIAPSAISRQIKNLEDELGAPLFERHARGVALTAAGEIYARYVRSALLDQGRVHAEIDDLRGLRRGHIRIHSVEGVVATPLTLALAKFHEKFGGVTLRLTVTGTEDVMRAVREGETDIGIAFTSDPDPWVRYEARLRHPLCAVVSPKHALASRTKLGLADTLQHAHAVPEKSFGIRSLIDAQARSSKLVLKPALVTNSIEAMRGFAREGHGVTFLPAITVQREAELGQLKAIPLSDREMQKASIDLCVQQDRRLPRAVEEFLSTLHRVLNTDQK